MQHALDKVLVQNLHEYALTASGGTATINARFVDVYGTTVYASSYGLTASAVALQTIYRTAAALPSGYLADNGNVHCFIADITSGSGVRVRFNGLVEGTLGPSGRLVDIAAGSFRLGSAPLVNHRVLGSFDSSLYTRALSFTNASVGTTAQRLVTTPSVGRKAIEVYNPNAGTYLYIGYDSTTDATSKHSRRISPYETVVLSAGDGLALFIIASGAGASVTYTELA